MVKYKECPDCGKTIRSVSTKCRSCANKLPKPSFIIKGECIDCGGIATTGSSGGRCRRCYLLLLSNKKMIPGLCADCGKQLKSYRSYRCQKCNAAINSMIASQIERAHKVKRMIGGYITLYMPNHPRANSAGRIFEHIIVAEEMLGRQISVKERIHHINHNKTDNRPENLVVMSMAEHAKHHLARNITQKSIYFILPMLSHSAREEIESILKAIKGETL